jgi:hypothetical protein
MAFLASAAGNEARHADCRIGLLRVKAQALPIPVEVVVLLQPKIA